MAIFSPLRNRRLAAKKNLATQQLIAFKLHQEWFALPIHTVSQVIILDKIYGDPDHKGIALTHYKQQEILVIDVGHLIFSQPQNPDLTTINSRFLVIIKKAIDDLVGLPIDSPPSIRRVPQESLKPLPLTYLTQGNIHCVSSLIVENPDEPPLFILDPEKIIHPLDQIKSA
jgi:chemotaxis signal transduction protein